MSFSGIALELQFWTRKLWQAMCKLAESLGWAVLVGRQCKDRVSSVSLYYNHLSHRELVRVYLPSTLGNSLSFTSDFQRH